VEQVSDDVAAMVHEAMNRAVNGYVYEDPQDTEFPDLKRSEVDVGRVLVHMLKPLQSRLVSVQRTDIPGTVNVTVAVSGLAARLVGFKIMED
jgi:UDP-N-acetyl-D-mannosaminuronic acid transferase (WecB/TagA/CpsF family)